MDELSSQNSPISRMRIRQNLVGVTLANGESPESLSPTLNSRPEISRQHRVSLGSTFSASSDYSTGRSDILAPIPRRPLLQVPEAQGWLQTPPISPVSSRAHSPSTPSLWHLNFSSLLEQERTKRIKPPLATESEQRETSLGARWVRWMHKNGMKTWASPLAVGAATCVKWMIGLGSYSGENTPPTFGDYEAQRHWMELTVHLPFSEWYTGDPYWWRLDYPPLTAYVSWLCGIVGSWINPEWFAMGLSHGHESPGSKVFMRSTVLILDILVYVPALILFVRIWLATRSKRTQDLALLVMLFQPNLLIIDFGHFQYNSVMLGLTLLAVNFFAVGWDLLGAVCFVLSLGFKQMALYYAPSIGCYLIGKCFYLGPIRGTRLFLRLCMVTLITLFLLFAPFLPPFAPLSLITHVTKRIFPVHRGLFEDKVANFWCASNALIKWKQLFGTAALVKLTLMATVVGFAPAAVGLVSAGLKARPTTEEAVDQTKQDTSAHSPTLPLLPYALLTTSLSFFLFSFHVHEKSILLPLLPMTMILSGATVGSSVWAWGVLMSNIGMFSMWPLLKRDGQGLQYFAMLLLWNRLVGCNPFILRGRRFVDMLSYIVYAAAATLHIVECLVLPPARYPWLFPMLNVLISTPVFVLTWLWSIKCGVQVLWALGGPGPAARKGKTTVPSPLAGASRFAGSGPSGENGEPRREWRQGGERAASLGYAKGASWRTVRPTSAL